MNDRSTDLSRTIVYLFAGVLAVIGVLRPGVAGAQTAATPGEHAGVVSLVKPQSSSPLTSGSSVDRFDLRPPVGAECQGDSQTGGYLVQTFVIPESDDPATLTYRSVRPTGDNQWALYADDSTPAVNITTAIADQAGGPGPIQDLPPFTFEYWLPDQTPDGDYRVGLACSQGPGVTRYWDTVVHLQNDAKDEPGHLRWAVVGASTSSSSGTSVWLFIGVAVAVVALVVLVAFLLLRRRRPVPRTPLTKEP